MTTLGLVSRSSDAVRNALKQVVTDYFQLLLDNRVQLAIGTDNINDTSPNEIEGLKWLGIFDNLTLLKMWTEATPKTIFPSRKIGMLRKGYEASFLALEGNPLVDLNNVRKIKLRIKQGNILSLYAW